MLPFWMFAVLHLSFWLQSIIIKTRKEKKKKKTILPQDEDGIQPLEALLFTLDQINRLIFLITRPYVIYRDIYKYFFLKGIDCNSEGYERYRNDFCKDLFAKYHVDF